MSRLFLVTSALAAALIVTPTLSAQTLDKIPVKVEGTFVFKLNVKVGQKYFAKPSAPWYSYFPYDPNMSGVGVGYPVWPQTWPPTDAGGAVEKMGATMRPVSYYQPPAYWYPR